MKNLHCRKVLICRTGSLGDTIVALPALRVVARAFPDAERWLLRKQALDDSVIAQAEVLEGTGLIQKYMTYQLETRDQLSTVLKLMRRIRAERFDTVIYLTIGGERKLSTALINILFFWLCGIRRIIGVPLRKDLRQSLPLPSALYEYEGSRLLRSIRALGTIDPQDAEAFDLMLSTAEQQGALAALAPLGESSLPIMALSVGAKLHLQNWGDEKWQQLITRLRPFSDRFNLVLLGSAGDRNRSTKLLDAWSGRGLNLCGTLSVRQSAVILKYAALFVGHDSGPMHLAAAVGAPCIAVFSSHDPPGEWFPFGTHHQVLYRTIDCQGCRLKVCIERGEACIRSISVDEVYQAVADKLSAITTSQSRRSNVITD